MREGRRLFYVALTRAANELVISSSSSMDLADANARGVKYHKGTIRRAGGRHTVRTIATPYLSELGPAAPTAIRGDRWLADRTPRTCVGIRISLLPSHGLILIFRLRGRIATRGAFTISRTVARQSRESSEGARPLDMQRQRHRRRPHGLRALQPISRCGGCHEPIPRRRRAAVKPIRKCRQTYCAGGYRWRRRSTAVRCPWPCESPRSWPAIGPH